MLGDIAAQKVPVSGDVGLLIEVPCSIASGRKNVTAMVEFGHGIFDSKYITYIIHHYLYIIYYIMYNIILYYIIYIYFHSA